MGEDHGNKCKTVNPILKTYFFGRFNAIKQSNNTIIKDTVRNDTGLVYVCINYFGEDPCKLL